MRIGTEAHYRWLLVIIAFTFILNVADGVLTVYWIFGTSVKEGNPLLVSLVNRYPVMFMIVKIALVLLGSVLLYRLRRNALAVIAIFFVFLVYYCLLLYHVNIFNLRNMGAVVE